MRVKIKRKNGEHKEMYGELHKILSVEDRVFFVWINDIGGRLEFYDCSDFDCFKLDADIDKAIMVNDVKDGISRYIIKDVLVEKGTPHNFASKQDSIDSGIREACNKILKFINEKA